MDRLLLMGNRTKQNSDGLPELNEPSPCRPVDGPGSGGREHKVRIADVEGRGDKRREQEHVRHGLVFLHYNSAFDV
jgi:hypothetical protein